MRYKAMAEKLRQATDTKDPTPTTALLAPLDTSRETPARDEKSPAKGKIAREKQPLS